MSDADGVRLVTVAIAALALGIVGEGLFQVLTYVSYSRQDTRTPLRSMAVQAVTFLVLAGNAFLVDGPALLIVLGLSFSVATTVGACHLAARLRKDSDRTVGRLGPSIRRVAAGTALMAVPAGAVAVLIPRWVDGRAGASVAVVAGALVGAIVYVLLQAWWRSPELAWLTPTLVRGRSRMVRDER
jgi:putative peptidoglycan lipid II flippase